MKIDSVRAQNIYDSYSQNKQQNTPNKTAEDSSVKGDKLELSSKASVLKDAKTLADKSLTSEKDRAAKIEQIKKQIDAGTYSVPSSEVAKSIMKGMLFDKKA